MKKQYKVDDDDERPDGLTITISNGSLRLTMDEAHRLIRLTQHEGFPVLRDLLKAVMDAATVTLRDRNCGIEDLRFAQGGSEAAGGIADLLTRDIPEWYTETVARRSDNHEDTP